MSSLLSKNEIGFVPFDNDVCQVSYVKMRIGLNPLISARKVYGNSFDWLRAE